MQHYDVVIVGGGAIGSACALFLARDPAFTGRIAVLERDPGYGDSSTARSAGSIRHQFSTAESIALSRFGSAFLRAPGPWLEVDGEVPELGFVEGGYLFLADAAGLPTLRANHALQRAHGADNVLLDPAGLAARFPWLHTADLAGGCLGLSGEGWFDPHALLLALRRKARRLGVDYLHAQATGFERAGRRVTSVALDNGAALDCGHVVNAAGARAAEVARWAGIDLPVRPRRRCVFHFRTPARLPGCPLVVAPDGLWFRPEGDGFIAGSGPLPGMPDPDTFDLEVDHALFAESLWPRLAARVPGFAELREGRAWAGLYEWNTVDQNAILGPHPDVDNLIFANGFSGHGLQHAPGVGRAIAELLIAGRFVTLDLARLTYAALLAGRGLAEHNVV